MTHEELLAKIDWIGVTKDAENNTLTPLSVAVMASLNALRAVVELCNFLDKKGRCCVPVQEVIDAIEKELG